MNIQAKSVSGWAAALASALAVAMAGTGTAAAGTAVAALAPRAGQRGVHAVSRPAQRAAVSVLDPGTDGGRHAAVAVRRGGRAPAGQPPGIPSPTHFAGVPTVGALFFTTGTKQHFCTASVVISKPENLILTAAHCVYGSSYASNIAFVPKYHSGQAALRRLAGQEDHRRRGMAELTQPEPRLRLPGRRAARPGTHRPIQQVTGGLRLGINLGYSHQIKVIGYNNTDDAPIRCATSQLQVRAEPDEVLLPQLPGRHQRRPLDHRLPRPDGTGTVFGVIGGYQQGGNLPWASYSAYFSGPARRLFRQAQGGG